MMRIKKIPQVYRNVQDSSITITYGQPKCSLIWLHGLGDTSEGFFSYFTHSFSPVYDGVRVKLIQAPLRNITINQGEVCNAWYDIFSTNRFLGQQKQAFNLHDVDESIKIIQGHVKQQKDQWKRIQSNSLVSPGHKIFVGGFSQGGAMSLAYSMQAEDPPGGAICFSGYMLRSIGYKNFKKFPALLMHGEKDPIIQEIMAKNSYKKLLEAQYLVQYSKVEGLQHTVNLDQLKHIQKWIKNTYGQIQKIYNAEVKK